MSFINQNPEATEYENLFTNVKNYILHSLGYPVVRVELTNSQLIQCIIHAVSKYQEYAAEDYAVRIASPSGNEVTIPDDINKRYISDVIFSGSFMDSFTKGFAMGGYEQVLGGVIPLGQYGFSRSNNILSNFQLTEYYMYLQKMEDFKKIVGIKKHFEIIGDTIYLFPAGQSFPTVGILYKDTLSEEEVEQITWIKDYALARAKMILGTIYAKMSALSSTGANVVNSDLKAEGRAEATQLEEDLMLMQRPLPFMQA